MENDEHLRRVYDASHLPGCEPPVAVADFAAHLSRQASGDASFAKDLAFALACARGSRAAIAELESTVIEAVPKALARLRPTPEVIDEVRQELREKLLVGDGTPKLLEYRGKGPLAAWIRVVALRIAYDRVRETQASPVADDEDALATLASLDDAPDLAHLRATYEVELRQAFREAVAGLPDEERAVLRSQAVDGLTIDQIGALYQVHRATAARWLQQARGSLLSGLRAALSRRLGIDHASCDSVVRLVKSRIDLSLERVLAEGAPSSEEA